MWKFQQSNCTAIDPEQSEIVLHKIDDAAQQGSSHM